MTEDLEKKLADDILKSGFGSEIRSLKIIKEAGWHATGSSHYIDLDTGLSRESDIQAHTLVHLASDDDKEIFFQSFYSLSIEVKKSDKPLIVFREKPNFSFEISECGYGLAFCDGLNTIRGFTGSGFLSESSLAEKLGWYGNGMHESFKKPDQPSRWYAACVSVCKAAEHELKQNSWEVDPSSSQYPYLWISKPVIVLDGLLYSADLDEDHELLLTPEKFSSLKFVFQNQNYKRREYFVDIVTLDNLKEYLSFCSDRNRKISEKLKKKAGIDA
jgi:hypothetical protein